MTGRFFTIPSAYDEGERLELFLGSNTNVDKDGMLPKASKKHKEPKMKIDLNFDFNQE